MAKRGNSKSRTPDAGGGKYVELVHRYGLDDPEPQGSEPPATQELAMDRLRAGNAHFATFMNNCRKSIARQPVVIPCDKTEVGLGEHDLYGRPKQSPFALVLGCSDAREPAEILFGQGFDDLFTVRVAGNVLGDECVGSVIYALDKFAPISNSSAAGGLKLILVVGHRNCGAVHAAVEAHEDDPSSLLERVSSTPHPLAAIVARIAPVVTVSAWAIDSSYGPGSSRDKKHTEVLSEIAAYLNAALGAYELSRIVKARFPRDSPPPVAVRFGVYDLSNDFVQGGPPPYASTTSQPKNSFGEPPVSPRWFPRAAEKIARSFAKKFPNGDGDMKRGGYTFSAWHRMAAEREQRHAL
jgi:carbonic anhydrase